MEPAGNRNRGRAIQMLVIATVFWGLSFPVTKALGVWQDERLPDTSSWFFAASLTVVRFGIAAVLVLIWLGPGVRSTRRLELWQGLGLGGFAGIGILLQVDGLAYTSASTSAFLTQAYCVILPLIECARDRRWPTGRVLASCGLVFAGLAMLSDFDPRTFRMGRGELETLASSAFFTAQVLWLRRPVFRDNRPMHCSLVMFAVMAVIALPVAWASMQAPSDWRVATASGAPIVLTSVLIVFCTLVSFLIMNAWQPHVSASEAGLIYAFEPVSAALLALCVPGWISVWTAVRYSNETLTSDLLLGGTLILTANIVLHCKRPAAPAQVNGG